MDDDDVSSTVLEDIYDEELLLNTDGFNITDDIWTLFFLSIGLRGGKAGGISWLDDCMVDKAGRLFCLCDDEDFVGNNVFDEIRCSSLYPSFISVIDVPCLVWLELRPGFRLN